MTTSVFPLHRIQMEDERINVAKFTTPKPPTLQKNKCKVLRRVEKEDKDEEQGANSCKLTQNHALSTTTTTVVALLVAWATAGCPSPVRIF